MEAANNSLFWAFKLRRRDTPTPETAARCCVLFHARSVKKKTNRGCAEGSLGAALIDDRRRRWNVDLRPAPQTRGWSASTDCCHNSWVVSTAAIRHAMHCVQSPIPMRAQEGVTL